MKIESTKEPESVEIRKLGVIDKVPVIYLYLNGDIKQETHVDIDNEEAIIYSYDSMQITAPLPLKTLSEIEVSLIAQHGYNQTTVKQKTYTKLSQIKETINTTTIHHIKSVDRLDELKEVTDTELEKLKNRIERDITPPSTSLG